MRKPPTYETIEGLVTRILPSGKALLFRENGAAHEICIPLSQIENGNEIALYETEIKVTCWLLNKLEEEGKR